MDRAFPSIQAAIAAARQDAASTECELRLSGLPDQQSLRVLAAIGMAQASGLVVRVTGSSAALLAARLDPGWTAGAEVVIGKTSDPEALRFRFTPAG